MEISHTLKSRILLPEIFKRFCWKVELRPFSISTEIIGLSVGSINATNSRTDAAFSCELGKEDFKISTRRAVKTEFSISLLMFYWRKNKPMLTKPFRAVITCYSIKYNADQPCNSVYRWLSTTKKPIPLWFISF